MVGRQAARHQAAHGMAHDVGPLDAQLAHERGHLGGDLVQDETRIGMAGTEPRQVDGRDAERAGEGGQVALPPCARAGQAMKEDEGRTLAGLHGHHRAMSRPALHDQLPPGIRKTRARPGTAGSSTIG